MTTMNLTLPNSIERHLREFADLEGITVEQFVMTAVTEKISALSTETYMRSRAQRADPAALRSILDRVPARPPMIGDE